MKKLFIDFIGVVGFSLAMSGVYIEYGLSKTLVISGVILLFYSLIAAWRNKK